MAKVTKIDSLELFIIEKDYKLTIWTVYFKDLDSLVSLLYKISGELVWTAEVTKLDCLESRDSWERLEVDYLNCLFSGV